MKTGFHEQANKMDLTRIAIKTCRTNPRVEIQPLNQMRIPIPTLLLAALLLLGGCTTIPVTEQSLEGNAETVAYVATVKLLQDRTEWEENFILAREELRILESANRITVVELMAILRKLPIKELGGNDVFLIEASILALEGQLGRVASENPTWLRAACRGLIAGITRGLPADHA